MSGTVSKGKDQSSQSLQMNERPLMTADELRNLPKGEFIVMKTGSHPMKVRMKLFFEWGIEFNSDDPYVIPEHGSREVRYASKADIEAAIDDKYGKKEEPKQKAEARPGGMSTQKHTASETADSVLSIQGRKGCAINTHAPGEDNHLASMLGCLIGKNN